MKTIMMALLLVMGLASNAQLAVLKATTSGGKTTAVIQNNYSCDLVLIKTSYRVSLSDASTDLNQPAFTFVKGSTITVEAPITGDFYFSFKPDNGGNINKCINGNGEVNAQIINAIALPVKWIQQPTVKWLDKNTIEVTYAVAEAVNFSHFNIKTSFNGIEWKVVAVQFADAIQPNRIYKNIIRL